MLGRSYNYPNEGWEYEIITGYEETAFFACPILLYDGMFGIFSIKKEVIEWLNENIGKENYHIFFGVIYIRFKFKKDAMLFKLRWE
jgi:hypothetical protein